METMKRTPTIRNGSIDQIIREMDARDWQKVEENACRDWFGTKYLNSGRILCSCCLEAAVEFEGLLQDHVCVDCQAQMEVIEHG